jgi:hypothetical protein
MHGNNRFSHSSQRVAGPLPKCLVLLATARILLACSALPGALTGNTPKHVSAKFWEAVEQNDQDSMLDCIEPDLRATLDPHGAIDLPMADWFRIVIEQLREHTGEQLVELTSLQCKELDNDGEVAHVEARGRVKIPRIGLVREFKLTHTLAKKDGQWYLTSPR